MSVPALTTTTAGQRLFQGLGAMGLTAVILAPRWSPDALTFDQNALTLRSDSSILAPFTGLRRDVEDLAATGVRNLDGTLRSGSGIVFELHPAAATRLETLVTARLGVAGGIRPVPWRAAIGPLTGAPAAPQWLAAGDELAAGSGMLLTFHDRRGGLICPVAVAALLADLLNAAAFPALCPAGSAGTAAGGLATVAGTATGALVHIIDPHGMPYSPPPAGQGLEVQNAANGTTLRPVPANGLVTLAAGEQLGPTAAATRLRFGWARNATMLVNPLAPPNLPAGVSLPRQFLRACAADLQWHVIGNRSAQAVQGIGPDDATLPAAFNPPVRDNVSLDFLADGVDVVGAAAQVIAPGTQQFAVSPTIATGVGPPPRPTAVWNPPLPASPDPQTHWPVFPAPPAGMPGNPVAGTPAAGLSAVWGSGVNDVVLTFAAGTLARGSHVRVYPQRFEVIRSIGPEPSFLRGNGTAGLVADETQPFSMLLPNPLALAPEVVRPADATLIFDLVVTDRSGVRQTYGNLVAPISEGTPPSTADPFAAGDPMIGFPAVQQSLAPSPVFGIPGGPLAPPAPTTLQQLLLSLASDTAPRIAPRVPTMARFPTLITAGTGPTNAAMTWLAVVSGGRWARETRSAMQNLGNPGGPAGTDVHAAGVRVDGALAFDVANHAIRRAQPILPVENVAPHGWISWVALGGWVAPAPGAAVQTCAGAALRTVAAGCETPGIDAVPVPEPVDDAQTVVNGIAAALGRFAPVLGVTNAATVLLEVRREWYVSRFGQRDALWALRRAVGQATSLVFVASPQFCATARPGASPAAHEIDLVAALADRMRAWPALRVVIATPRVPDADTAYGGWVREALAARAEAYDALRAVDPERVVMFHPAGFPGRDAAIRTTTVIVDDMWSLVGTSHWRRRGMTFDEGVDIAGFDRALDATGASARVRAFRRALMASMLRVPVPPAGAVPDGDWVKLSEPAGTYDFVAALAAERGLGRIMPFWPGPTDTDVLAQSHDVADPDGATTDNYLNMFAGLVGEEPD